MYAQRFVFSLSVSRINVFPDNSPHPNVASLPVHPVYRLLNMRTCISHSNSVERYESCPIVTHPSCPCWAVVVAVVLPVEVRVLVIVLVCVLV
jgi:hypothetical protein